MGQDPILLGAVQTQNKKTPKSLIWIQATHFRDELNSAILCSRTQMWGLTTPPHMVIISNLNLSGPSCPNREPYPILFLS